MTQTARNPLGCRVSFLPGERLGYSPAPRRGALKGDGDELPARCGSLGAGRVGDAAAQGGAPGLWLPPQSPGYPGLCRRASSWGHQTRSAVRLRVIHAPLQAAERERRRRPRGQQGEGRGKTGPWGPPAGSLRVPIRGGRRGRAPHPKHRSSTAPALGASGSEEGSGVGEPRFPPAP